MPCSFVRTTGLLMHHVQLRVCRKVKSPRWLSPPIAQIWGPAIPGFSQNFFQITFEREEISDCWWDSGKYGQMIAMGRTVWGPKEPTFRGLRHRPMYNISCICFNKCLYFFIFHGWIPSGQTLYKNSQKWSTVLVPSGCYNKIAHTGVVNKQQKCIPRRDVGWKSETGMPA